MADEVVKRLLLEIDGSVEKLRRELRKGEAEVKAFAGAAQKSTLSASAGADAMANRQANAARAIASATETIARQGKVSGEAAKQIIAQGANAAMFWGPQGAVVGAIGISTLAIVGMFTRIKREAAEAAKETRAEFAKLSSMDLLGAAQRLGELNEGDRMLRARLASSDPRVRDKARAQLRDDFTQGGVRGLREERARLQREIASMRAVTDRRDGETLAEAVRRREQMISDLKEINRLLPEITERAEFGLQAVLEKSAQQGEVAEGQLTVWRDEKRKRDEKKDAQDATQEVAELSREAEAFAKRFSDFVLKTVGSSVEQLAATFDELIMQATELEGKDFSVDYTARIAQLVELRERAVRSATMLAGVDQQLKSIELTLERGGGADVDMFTALATQADVLFAELLKLHPESKEYLATQERLLKVEKQRADLLDGVADANNDGRSKGPAVDVRTAADYAREIQQAADGALQLMQHLGGADASLVSMLRNVGQIAGSLPALMKHLKAGDGLGIISSGLPILGALSSMLGDSEADRRHRESIAENTKALKELTARAGQLGLGVTGTAAGDAAAQLQRLLGSPDFWRASAGVPGRGRIEDVARRLGVDLADLEAIAQAHGITLDGSTKAFLQLQEALGLTITKLGEFDDSLDSQRAQAEAEIALFGVTDPAEQARIRRRAFAGRSAALDGVSAGLDLDTAEGRAEARRRAQELFNVMRAGGGTLSESQLGGLTGDQLLDALRELIDGFDAIDGLIASATGSSSGTVSGFRGLTDAAGNRLEDRMRSLDHKATAAQETRLAILATLQRLAGVPMPVPQIDAGTFTRSGVHASAPVIINVHVGGLTLQQHFSGAVDPAAVGRAAALGMEQVSEYLARELRYYRRRGGDLSMDDA